MVRWLRWHCPPDTGFEIRTLAVWGRARYLSVTEAPHNTNFHTWMGKEHFCFFQTAETGNRTPNSGVKGSGANHYPRAPAHIEKGETRIFLWINPRSTQNYNPSKHNTFIQRRPNVFDVGRTLYKCYTDVLCLLGLDILHIDQGCSILTGGYGTAVFGTRLTAHAPTSCIHEIVLTL